MVAEVRAAVVRGPRPRADTGRGACGIFYAAGLSLFAVTAWMTVARCIGMSTAGTPMPGGWTMSMTWMRMPGRSWPAALAAFLAMWSPMMVAMMLPSLLPALWRYRQAIGHARGLRQAGLVVLVAIAYFLVWTALGLVVFPAGAAVAALLLQSPTLSRAVPPATAAVVLAAAALQFTRWKARRLARCRRPPRMLPANAALACRHGLCLGTHCIYCGAGLVAAQLAIGVMDLRAMAIVAAVATAERLGRGRR